MEHLDTQNHDTLRERFLVEQEHRFLSLVHLFLDGQTDACTFRQSLRLRWAEEREALWQAAYCLTERDFRPLARLLDRLNAIRLMMNDPNDLHRQVSALLDSYQAAKVGDTNSLLWDAPRLNLFERPLPEGWVYPCSLQYIRDQLACVPEHDLEGLWAVGLMPAARKEADCYGTYYRREWPIPRPMIVLWSQPASLSFKTKAHYSARKLERLFSQERSYGMEFQDKGSRTICHWELPRLRVYMTEHILLHEIGHHVQRRQRQRAGYSPYIGHTASEQFAEDYALRTLRLWKGGHLHSCRQH